MYLRRFLLINRGSGNYMCLKGRYDWRLTQFPTPAALLQC